MRIAVQTPHFLLSDGSKSFTGYENEFTQTHARVLYLPGWRALLSRGRGYKNLLLSRGVDPDTYDFAFTAGELNRKADALVCFNYLPHAAGNSPPRTFRGLKVWHTMDFVFNAPLACQALEQGGVDAVMGYGDHGRHSTFFQSSYRRYADRVIPVPFGFASRFEDRTPFDQRMRKVIALGSVNPLDEAGIPPEASVEAYVRFHPGEQWTHRWRRKLVEQGKKLKGSILDSQLPEWPETKNPAYDAVEMLNRYALFANDEGLMAFPPARTYEGMAAGAVMVGNAHPCYEDIGLEDGVNCVLHAPLDLADFEEKVSYYLSREDQLREIAQRGKAMVRDRFSHPRIALELKRRLESLWRGDTANAFANWRQVPAAQEEAVTR